MKERGEWRKLHVGVDDQGYIVAVKLTESTEDDASTLPDLLEQVDDPVSRFTADAAYDRRPVYDLVGDLGTSRVRIVIPPHRRAIPSSGGDAWAQRNAALERIAAIGRQAWQKESGYRQQARVENPFGRYKRVLGEGLHARDAAGQEGEAMLACNVLNRMLDLGRPRSARVVT